MRSSYSEYPTRTDYGHPQSAGFIEDLFSHYLVTDYQDAMEEVCSVSGLERDKHERMLKKAVDLHNIDAEALFDEGESPEEDRLTKILGESPSNHVIDPPTPTLIASIYALGMGIGEIEEVLSDHTGKEFSETSIRDSLKRCGLLAGKPTESNDTQGSVPLAEDDIQLGGTTVNMHDESESEPDDTDIIIR